MTRLLTLLVLLLLPGAAPAENWPGWRGPDHDGVSPEKGLPTRWSTTENVRWKAELPGAGVSAPVVWGERVFVTASDGRLGDRLHLLCFHRDSGKKLWHARFFGSAASEGQFAPGGMAVSTPATDGKRVFALFGTGDHRWRTKRDASVNWSSPLPVTVGKERQIVAAGTYALRGYAADTGVEL